MSIGTREAAPSATSAESPAEATRVPWRELPVVAGVALAFYLATMAENFCDAHDSITYINEIDRGEWFNPHHLLFRWLAGQVLAVAQWVAPAVDSAVVVQGMNSVFGAGCLAVVYAFHRAILGLDRRTSGVFTALPGVSFGLWYYSTAIEVYIVPLFFLLLALFQMCRRDLRPRQMAWVGLWHGLAVLFHMVHGLFGLTIIAAMLARRGQPGFSALRGFGVYLVVAFFVSTVPYALVVHQRGQQRELEGKSNSLRDVARWWAGHAQEDRYWNGVSAKTLVKASVGFSQSFVGGHFSFASGPLADRVVPLLGDHSLQDERFLVRGMGDRAALALLALACLAGGAVLLGTVWQLRRWRAIRRQHPLALAAMLTWLASYMGFFYLWEPDNVEFWIPQSVLLWLLAGLLWTAGRGGADGRPAALPRRALAGIAVVAALLAAVNFLGSIRYLMERENDLYYARSAALAEYAGPGDLVILADGWIYEGYVERYTGAQVKSLRNSLRHFGTPEEKIATLHADIARTLAAGHRVVLHGDVVNTPGTTGGGQGLRTEDLLGPLRPVWVERQAGMNTVYLITAPPVLP